MKSKHYFILIVLSFFFAKEAVSKEANSNFSENQINTSFFQHTLAHFEMAVGMSIQNQLKHTFPQLDFSSTWTVLKDNHLAHCLNSKNCSFTTISETANASFAPVLMTTIASDNFNSNDGSGGSGWSGSWTFSNASVSGSSPGGFTSPPTLFMEGGTFGTADRTVDLSTYASATLSLDFVCDDSSTGFENDDFVRVRVSTNGGSTFTDVWYRDGDQVCPSSSDNQLQSVSVSIAPGSANTVIRLESGTTSGSEDVYWDNITVEGVASGSGGIIGNTQCNDIITTCFTNGARTHASVATDPAIIGFAFTIDTLSDGTYANTNSAVTPYATIGNIGAVWGLAWNRKTQKLYASAFLKRHADISPGGLGGIFEIDPNSPLTGTSATTPWLDINNTTYLGGSATLFPSETAANRGLNAKSDPNNDSWAYTRVGKEGIGDIEFSEDYSRLYVMDLTNRQLLIIDAVSQSLLFRIAVSDPGCNGGADNYRPFAIKEYNGELYISITCTGETTKVNGDIAGYIYQLDDLANPTAFNLTLDISSSMASTYNAGVWRHWMDDHTADDGTTSGYITNPTPLLSDIEFDANGNMVVGVMDRSGHQYGYLNYPPTGTDIISIINRGTINHQSASGMTWTPEPDPADYYFISDLNRTDQRDAFSGGMVLDYCNSIEYLVSNLMDPFDFNSAGVLWNVATTGLQKGGNANGNNEGRLELLPNQGNPDNFGKGAALGDMISMRPACSTSIDKVSAVNCNSGTLTAEWEVIFSWKDHIDDTLMVQRNSLAPTQVVGTEFSDTLNITGVPADGGLYDTIRIYFKNDLVCGDTIIIKRPAPCPDLICNQNLLVVSRNGSKIELIDSDNGSSLGVFADFNTSPINGPHGITQDDDGNIYLANADGSNILKYASNGTYLGVLATGITDIASVTYGPDGFLYALQPNPNNAVLRVNTSTGSYTTFNNSGEYANSQVVQPTGILFGPDGHLYVVDQDGDAVEKYNGTTGAHISTFVASPDISNPFDFEFGPDGNFYVSQQGGCSCITQHDGTTGALLGTFATLSGLAPGGINFGPDGNLYVADVVNNRVEQFDGTTGAHLGVFASGTIPEPKEVLFACAGTNTAIQSGEICSSISNTEVGGTVWEDWDYDGSINQNDTIGVQGVQVDLYDDCGSVTQTTYTDSNGNYLFTGLTNGTSYRIEFSLPEIISCWAKPTRAGADNGTTVQFVQPGNCASLGIASPSDYCQQNPLLATPCYVSGDPTAGGSSGTGDWWVSFRYNSSGEIGEAGYTSPEQYVDGTTIGTTWGSAYHRVSQHFLLGATMKRHSGFGVNGTGAIYKIDASGTASLFVDLNSIAGIDTGTDTRDGSTNNTLPASSTDLSRDINAFEAVGKVGLGDLELSDDGQTLYAINLHQRSLVEMLVGDNLTAPTSANTYDIATITEGLVSNTAIACGSINDYRPWGLKFHKGMLYIGVVCSAESTQTASDLQAYVLSFDPTRPENGFSLVLNLSMDYTREPAFQSDNPAQTIAGTWRPWALEYNDATILPWRGAAHPSPILSDIEIDGDGSFILGFMDRFGMQSGYRQFQTDLSDTNADHQGLSAGDVIRFCNINGNLVQEGQAGCPYNVSPPWTDPGDFVPQGEFYASEEFFTNITSPAHGHPETSMGNLALFYGTGELVAGIIDPFVLRSGGIAWWSNTDGSAIKEYELYEAIDQSTPDGTFSKAVGLGDIELRCDVAPLEIGNYVWQDTDRDGIQDACETGIASVTVELVKGGVVIASTQTDSNGQYYFSDKNATDPNLTWSGTGADTALLANTAYVLRISNAEGGSQQAALSGLSLTTPDANSNNSNEIDSDAQLNVTNAEISLTTGDYGCVDHSFDFGFNIPCPTDFCLDNHLLVGSGSFFQITWDSLLNNWVKPPEDPNLYPNTQTLTIPGSSITVDLTMSHRPRNDNGSTTFSNIARPSTGASTINDVNWAPLTGDDEVFRYFKDATDNPVTMTMTFSEPVLLYELVTGNPAGLTGTVILGVHDDSITVNANQVLNVLSANTVVPNPAHHPNPGTSVFVTGTDDPNADATVNFFAHNDMGGFNWGVGGDITNPAPSVMNFMETYPDGSTDGRPIFGYEGGYYYSLSTETARDWMVFDYAGVQARSISWRLFRETAAFSTALENGSATFADLFDNPDTGNKSAYFGNFQLQRLVCPDQTHEICLSGGGATSVTLTADASKTTDVIWYNSSDVQVGTGNTLTVNSSTSGMSADSTENFYYTGTDIASGCSGQSCCPIIVNAVSCCPTDAGLSNKTCSENGTPANTSDDYILFDLNPTGSNLTGTYSVSVSSGSISPSSGTYGVATTFQLQSGSVGAGDVTVTLTDDSDNNCTLDVTITDLGECVFLDLTKTASVANASFGDTITYTYTVTNNSLDSLTLSDLTDDKLGTISTKVQGTSSNRVTDQLQVLYRFEDGSGTTISDNSGVSPALDLTIQNGNYNWGIDSLDFTGANRADNTTDNNKIFQSITSSGALTVEAWIRPDNNTQGGASRILSLSLDNSDRNFQLMQNGNIYEFRLRTSNDGTNEAETVAGTINASPTLQHVVYTYDGTTAQFYINGVAVSTFGATNPTGDFSTWDAAYDFAIGNENSFASTNTQRDWQGEFHLAAVYSKALNASEVSQNYNAGAGLSLVSTVLGNGDTSTFTETYIINGTETENPYKNIATITGTPQASSPLMATDSAEVNITPCITDCTENTTTYTMDWSQIGWVNPDGATTYPYIQTFTNIAGSGVDMTVTVHQEPNTSSGYNMANPGCASDRCLFETEVTSYAPSGEVLRLFKKDNTFMDSISISFSEPVLLDNFMTGGERPPNGGDYGVSQLTFWDGADGTGNKVGASDCSWLDVGASEIITVEQPLSTTAPINILDGTTTGGEVMGNQTTQYYNGSFYAFGEETGLRPWTVLNLDSVYVQSIKWSTYASSVNDPATTADNRISSGNLSAYISSFDFMKCATATPAQIGNFVWTDTDQDGIQDAGEPGVEGIKVILFNTSNVALDSSITNSGGFYLLDSIAAGDYYLKFDIPTDWTITAKDQLTNDTIDSDIDPITMQTDNFTVAAGDSTMTFDVGLYACKYNLVVTGHISNEIYLYDGDDGSLIKTITTAGATTLGQPNSIACGPDGYLYISDFDSGKVMRFDKDLNFVSDFITGVNGTETIAFGASGDAYVVSWGNQTVSRYDKNGVFKNIVADSGDGLTAVQWIDVDVQERIYVGIGNDVIKRFMPDGTFIDDFITDLEPTESGSVTTGDMRFGPNGNFYVANHSWYSINEFTPDGTFVGRPVEWNFPIDNDKMLDPRGFTFGPDGHFYVTSGGNDKIIRYDGTTGAFIDDFVTAGLGGLQEPFDVKFVPVTDCTTCPPSICLPVTVTRKGGTN